MDLLQHAAIDDLLADARADLDRVRPPDLAAEVAAGALVVDIRSFEQRLRGGPMPEAIVVDRNVLEWRLDPTSASRLPEATSADLHYILVCEEGYSSSLAAATLHRLGLTRVTDLVGGFRGWAAWERARVARRAAEPATMVKRPFWRNDPPPVDSRAEEPATG